jgi:hypothetical protein
MLPQAPILSSIAQIFKTESFLHPSEAKHEISYNNAQYFKTLFYMIAEYVFKLVTHFL